jgi:hypothetical protein
MMSSLSKELHEVFLTQRGEFPISVSFLVCSLSRQSQNAVVAAGDPDKEIHQFNREFNALEMEEFPP